jgi:hypothetical protein
MTTYFINRALAGVAVVVALVASSMSRYVNQTL